MTDVTEMPSTPENAETADLVVPDEKSLLMQRARLMGIKFSNNISVEGLKAKIASQMEADVPASEPVVAPPPQIIASVDVASPKATIAQIRKQLMDEQLKLVRLRITCLDPKKKDLPGEIFTVANDYIGTVRKFVPFGEQTENGYHVPFCIYQMLKDRKFLHVRTLKSKNGREQVETSYVPEFALEVLPQLTATELRELAIQQAASAGKI